MITRLKALKVMQMIFIAAFYWVHSTDAIHQRTGKSHAKPLGHVKEACFDSCDVFNMNMYLEFCG